MHGLSVLSGAVGGAAIAVGVMALMGSPAPAAAPRCPEGAPTAAARPAQLDPEAQPPAPVVAVAHPAPPPDIPQAAPTLAEAPAMAPAAAPPSPVAPPSLAPCDPASAAELTRLRGEVKRLETELAATKPDPDENKTYDLSSKTLRTMASNCELRWDSPKLSVDVDPTLDPKDAAAAGLTEAQAAEVNEELRAWNRSTLAELRRLFTAVTGDEEAANLSPEAMFSEIQDKSEKREVQMVFERISAERAGLPAPAGVADDSPLLETYRMLTTTGDALEVSIGKRLGPDVAHALRDQRRGWGSRHSSSFGCPTRR